MCVCVCVCMYACIYVYTQYIYITRENKYPYLVNKYPYLVTNSRRSLQILTTGALDCCIQGERKRLFYSKSVNGIMSTRGVHPGYKGSTRVMVPGYSLLVINPY